MDRRNLPEHRLIFGLRQKPSQMSDLDKSADIMLERELPRQSKAKQTMGGPDYDLDSDEIFALDEDTKTLEFSGQTNSTLHRISMRILANLLTSCQTQQNLRQRRSVAQHYNGFWPPREAIDSLLMRTRMCVRKFALEQKLYCLNVKMTFSTASKPALDLSSLQMILSDFLENVLGVDIARLSKKSRTRHMSYYVHSVSHLITTIKYWS
uniref:Uncharacterized protein n=1 Tax=Ditylenchus dipsaci TaxID=166011 RepID=A0A915D7I5_9BILA